MAVAVPAAALMAVGQGAFIPSVGPVAAHGLAWAAMAPIQHRIVSGRAATLLQGEPQPADEIDTFGGPQNYFPTSDDGCPASIGGNIKVNQNCLNLTDASLSGRGQSQNETSIAQNPMHPERIVASFNDYRRGDGNCYGAFSLDNGKSWTDTTIPMSFTRGGPFGAAREYWQAGGDTAVAWDSRGNAYFQCQVFLRGTGVTPNKDLSSAVYVFRSTQNSGASWNFPGRPVIEFNDVAGSGTVLEDKPLMTVDNHAGSPFRDRVYVVYTEFAADGTAYIYETYSNDYAEHFSPRKVASITSPLCDQTYGLPTPQGKCNENQFAQPFTGSDGALYIVYNNFNNLVSGSENRNQMLLVKSTDGGNTFSAPVKVADYYDLPDCMPYQGQDPGRACVPEKGSSKNSFFRATNYSSGAVDPRNPAVISVAFGSYINKNSKESNGCVPAGLAPDGNNLFTGVKTPGACNNDILVSVSTNGGASFTGTTTDPRALTSATDRGKQKVSDQFWQWADYTRDGKFAIAYYDRQYGNDETTGFSDISLSGSRSLADFGVKRVTSSSMPPPTQFGGLFYGDYNALSAITDAHPLWADTRSPALFLCPGTGTPGVPPRTCKGSASNAQFANDEDIFTATVAVPGDQGEGEGDNTGDNGGGGGGD